MLQFIFSCNVAVLLYTCSTDKYFLLKLVPGQIACKKDLPGRIKRLSTTTMEAWWKWLITKEENSYAFNAFDVSVVLLK